MHRAKNRYETAWLDSVLHGSLQCHTSKAQNICRVVMFFKTLIKNMIAGLATLNKTIHSGLHWFYLGQHTFAVASYKDRMSCIDGKTGLITLHVLMN